MHSDWQIRDTQRKGKGVFAMKDLPAGTLIVNEPPLFKIPPRNTFSSTFDYRSAVVDAVANLGPALQQVYNSLGPPIDSSQTIYPTFEEHAQRLGGTENASLGIFPTITRFNHSCSPNAVYHYNEQKKLGYLVLSKDVIGDEEITMSYLRENFWMISREERARNFRKIGFRCLCDLCEADGRTVRKSDDRRRKLARLSTRLEAAARKFEDPIEAMRDIRSMLKLYAKEGERGLAIRDTLLRGHRICIAYSDFARASLFPRLAADVEIRCKGLDRDDIEDIETNLVGVVMTQSDKWYTIGAADTYWNNQKVFEDWLWTRCRKEHFWHKFDTGRKVERYLDGLKFRYRQVGRSGAPRVMMSNLSRT